MTYSRAVRTTIGPKCLTAVFGMGTPPGYDHLRGNCKLTISNCKLENLAVSLNLQFPVFQLAAVRANLYRLQLRRYVAKAAKRPPAPFSRPGRRGVSRQKAAVRDFTEAEASTGTHWYGVSMAQIMVVV